MKSTDTDNIAQKTAKILVETGAVSFRPRQPFRFDSGILSPIYVDNRLLISGPKERTKIIKFFIQKIRQIGFPDLVAGTATAGIPHAAWVAQQLNIPMVYVRAKAKDHGKGNMVEGVLKRGQKVIIIEDTVSTAGSSIRVIEAIRKLGGKVASEVAIYTHTLKVAQENFKEHKVKFHPLTDLKSVTEVAQKLGYLKQDQTNSIIEWARDPQGWGVKMGFE